ncbi:universal stress protein UspA [Sedimentibacter sp. zth1]|uniref:universal stress protein UspA n=1 Tax=Sedimentibacter sp. zth1 TaxID=2816908 RepID=UPI001A911D99|nr:universal stress protein UspA [Sedimentibacter sp. zth1]QSX06961.1 universal stress protein UspA [Sedimentibacter sp. zth1]
MQKNIMVCVTQQRTCEKLIRTGYELYKKDLIDDNNALYVIHVVNENDKLLFNLSDGDALEYLFEITKELGADLVIKRSKDVIASLVDFAMDKNITHIVIGNTTGITASRNFEQKLRKKISSVKFIS